MRFATIDDVFLLTSLLLLKDNYRFRSATWN